MEHIASRTQICLEAWEEQTQPQNSYRCGSDKKNNGAVEGTGRVRLALTGEREKLFWGES